MIENLITRPRWSHKDARAVAALSNSGGGRLLIGPRLEGDLDTLEAMIRRDIFKATGMLIQDIGHKSDDSGSWIEVMVPNEDWVVPYRGEVHICNGGKLIRLQKSRSGGYIVHLNGKTPDRPANKPSAAFSASDLDSDALQAAGLKPDDLEALFGSSDAGLPLLELILFGDDPSRYCDGFSIRLTGDKCEDRVTGPFATILPRLMDSLATHLPEGHPYPLPVLEELLFNALIHNDYTSGDAITVCIHQDSISITNHVPPLSLLMSGTEANKGLIKVLKDQYPGLGKGLASVVTALDEAGLDEPVVRLGQGAFTITLSAKREESTFDDYDVDTQSITSQLSAGSKKERTRTAILALVSARADLTYDEIADLANVSSATVKRQIAELKQEGLIERIGGRKSGSWRVLKE